MLRSRGRITVCNRLLSKTGRYTSAKHFTNLSDKTKIFDQPGNTVAVLPKTVLSALEDIFFHYQHGRIASYVSQSHTQAYLNCHFWSMLRVNYPITMVDAGGAGQLWPLHKRRTSARHICRVFQGMDLIRLRPSGVFSDVQQPRTLSRTLF